MELTKAEKKIAAALLDRAAEEFSNHGCNDFELLTEANLTREEALEIANTMHAYQKEDDATYDGHPANPNATHLYSYDWMLMQMLAKKLLED